MVKCGIMTRAFDFITLTDLASITHGASLSWFGIPIHAKAFDCHAFEASAPFRDILPFFMPNLTLLLLNWLCAKEPASSAKYARMH